MTATTASAISGMMTNCATTPSTTGSGLRATSAKSTGLRVSPMPNMTMPSSGVTCGAKDAAVFGAM